MPFLIDGHNLIPHMPGMSLQDLDDETKLIQVLQEYARIAQTNLEVYFDRAAPGHIGTRQLGRIKVVFVSSRIIADEQIIKRIRSLGNSIKNWVVVTSDQRIQVEAKAVRSGVMGSDDFARKMINTLEIQEDAGANPPEISPREVDEWLLLFRGKK
jgi:uncharacterized protein